MCWFIAFTWDIFDSNLQTSVCEFFRTVICTHEVLLRCSVICSVKGKGKGRALDIAPQVDTATAEAYGAHQAASHVPALYLPSYSRYSFTDPERMEG